MSTAHKLLLAAMFTLKLGALHGRPAAKKTLHTGRLVLRCLNCDCVCQVHLCLSLCQNRLLPIYSPFAAQRFNNLSPMSVMCPLPSGTMTSPQPSVMLLIRAYNWYLSRVTIAILIRDFCLSVRHVMVFCLNKSTQHQTRLSFLLHERNIFHLWNSISISKFRG